MGAKVLVRGGNFGGLTTALSVKHELSADVDDRRLRFGPLRVQPIADLAAIRETVA